MIYRLDLPHVFTRLNDFVFHEWLVGEGSEVTPGDPVCRLLALTPRQAAGQTGLVRNLRSRRQRPPAADEATVWIRVLAAEAGTVETLAVEAGARLQTGSTLATMRLGPEDTAAGAFRAVADVED